ncbi:hypothetical protein [Streptococcus sp. FT1-106]|uniref:hypothetical protein n=2 Tax=Streptococcus TaxID=1301 RepID=UPI003BF4EF3C
MRREEYEKRILMLCLGAATLTALMTVSFLQNTVFTESYNSVSNKADVIYQIRSLLYCGFLICSLFSIRISCYNNKDYIFGRDFQNGNLQSQRH